MLTSLNSASKLKTFDIEALAAIPGPPTTDSPLQEDILGSLNPSTVQLSKTSAPKVGPLNSFVI